MPPQIVDHADQLNAPWFTALLREAGVLSDAGSVTSAVAQPFGTGQMARVLRAELSYDGEAAEAPSSLILKIPSEDAGSRALAAAIGAYESEVRFYQDILPQLEISTPRCFGGVVEPETGRFTLALEDLSVNWRTGDGVNGGTTDEVRAALRELVELHAPSWNAPLLAEHGFLNRPGRVEALYRMAGPALPAFRERFAHRLEPEHVALAERLAPLSRRFPEIAWNRPFTLQHNDYRLDNLLFAETGEGLRVAVIDWQALAVGPPMVDLAIHLTTSLTPVQRREHQDELLREYHSALLAHGVEDFAFEQCMECYRHASLHPFLVGVGTSVALAQSERGDEMFAALVGRSAELVMELGAEQVLA